VTIENTPRPAERGRHASCGGDAHGAPGIAVPTWFQLGDQLSLHLGDIFEGGEICFTPIGLRFVFACSPLLACRDIDADTMPAAESELHSAATRAWFPGLNGKVEKG